MSLVRIALAAAVTAAAVARHPAVRAGLRVAPQLITPAMREKAADAALAAAYRAGAAARRMVPRKLIGDR